VSRNGASSRQLGHLVQLASPCSPRVIGRAGEGPTECALRRRRASRSEAKQRRRVGGTGSVLGRIARTRFGVPPAGGGAQCRFLQILMCSGRACEGGRGGSNGTARQQVGGGRGPRRAPPSGNRRRGSRGAAELGHEPARHRRTSWRSRRGRARGISSTCSSRNSRSTGEARGRVESLDGINGGLALADCRGSAPSRGAARGEGSAPGFPESRLVEDGPAADDAGSTGGD